jgi:glycosyltransferase involved in cell wall biosynthesis
MVKVAIIGSHGLYANYGGWDQLVKNLAEKKSSDKIHYLVFNSKEAPKDISNLPNGVIVKHINLNASGFEGLFYDFWTILLCFFTVDTILLLGVQGIPLITFLKIFKKTKIISNVGGLEWERPKFSYWAKLYLKFCFHLSFILSKNVILDNKHYLKFAPNSRKYKAVIIPYGGEIDTTLEITKDLSEKYPFLEKEYYLSISRALEDNYIDKICDTFSKTKSTLVLISNFTTSKYGKKVFERYSNTSNIILINGLYQKNELDLIRRKCKAYIHTHTLCGTAPSLVEMIISKRPIISIDVPQNRFTLDNTGIYFESYDELVQILESNLDLNKFLPKMELKSRYDWQTIVNSYQHLY